MGHVDALLGGDCDDSNGARHPDASETCATGFDDDCDGEDNDLDAAGCTRRYRDLDRDGYYPTDAPSECRCTAVGSFTSTTSGDCDDSTASIHPDADDVCDGVNNDCDDSTDEDADCGLEHCCGGDCHECCDASDCGWGFGCRCIGNRCSPTVCRHDDDCCPFGCEWGRDEDCM